MSFHATNVVTNVRNFMTRNLHLAMSKWLRLRLEKDGHEVSLSDAKVAAASILMKTQIFRDAKLDYDSTRSVDLDSEIDNRRIDDNDPLDFLRQQRVRFLRIHKEVHGSMQCSICGVSHLSFHISSSLVKTIHTINIAFRSPALETGKALQTFCTFW